MRYLAILAVWAAVFFGASAEAQQTIIVQNCGQLSPQYTVGVQGRAITMDVNGNQCSSSGIGGFPGGSTAIQGNGSGSTGAVTGTLAGAAGKTTYLCDFDVSAIGGTAPVGPITITGLLGGTKTYQGSASAAGATISKSFAPCIPASGTNIAIVITTTANGTATAVNVNSSGYQQ